MNSRISYDQLSEKVGAQLEVDPTHIRFYTVNGTTGNPRGAVKRSVTSTLGAILNPSGYGALNTNQRNDALYFEVLDMSLAELDTKKNFKITYLSEGITKEVRACSLVPRKLCSALLVTPSRINSISWLARAATLRTSSTH